MRLFRNTRALVLLGLLVLILIVAIPLIVFLVLAKPKQHMPGGLTPIPRVSQTPGGAQSWPVISSNVPVFASSRNYPASNANNGNYHSCQDHSQIVHLAWVLNLNLSPLKPPGHPKDDLTPN